MKKEESTLIEKNIYANLSLTDSISEFTVIRQMDEFIAKATGERCQTMVTQRNYLLRAYTRISHQNPQTLIKSGFSVFTLCQKSAP